MGLPCTFSGSSPLFDVERAFGKDTHVQTNCIRALALNNEKVFSFIGICFPPHRIKGLRKLNSA